VKGPLTRSQGLTRDDALDEAPALWGSASSRLVRRVVELGPGSRAAGLTMAFKLLEAAQQRWRSVNAPRLVALVRAGAKFEKGVLIERPTEQDQEAAV
jgi:putative transposase